MDEEHMQKVQELCDKVTALCDELHTHAEQVSDPKCAALCETSSEVMNGVSQAFEHFLHKSEKAWQ